MKAVDFSLPIFVDGGSVLVRAKSRLKRLADLYGKKIAVIGGTTTEEAIVRALNALSSTAILVPVKDGAEGMRELARGGVDAYAADRVVLARLRQRQAKPADFDFIDGDFSFEPYALVMGREDPELRLIVNRTLAGLYRSGDIDPIFQRWLGHLGPPRRPAALDVLPQHAAGVSHGPRRFPPAPPGRDPGVLARRHARPRAIDAGQRQSAATSPAAACSRSSRRP